MIRAVVFLILTFSVAAFLDFSRPISQQIGVGGVFSNANSSIFGSNVASSLQIPTGFPTTSSVGNFPPGANNLLNNFPDLSDVFAGYGFKGHFETSEEDSLSLESVLA